MEAWSKSIYLEKKRLLSRDRCVLIGGLNCTLWQPGGARRLFLLIFFKFEVLIYGFRTPPLLLHTFESVGPCMLSGVSVVALLANVQAWHVMHIRSVCIFLTFCNTLCQICFFLCDLL